MIFSRTKGWIGIDLGTDAVKLAQVTRRGGRFDLSDAIVIRRTEGWSGNAEEAVSSHDEIRAALSLGGNFSGRAAAVTLPMAVCDVRTCSIPTGDAAQTRQAVLRELNSVYGDTEATRDFDYWSTGEEGEGPENENAIALSVPSYWTDRVARDLKEARLEGNVLDALPLSLARALALSPTTAPGPVAALDWGHCRATLCAVMGGQPRFVRCLRGAGFETIVAAVCQQLAVTEEEAQQLIWEHGLAGDNGERATDLQRVIEEVTRDALGGFLEELARTIGFLRGQRRELAPTKLVLFGGGASINNIAEYLAPRIELPVETWRLAGASAASRQNPARRENRVPIELLGPAVALSSLAW